MVFVVEVCELYWVVCYLEELVGLYYCWYDNCCVILLSDDLIESVYCICLWFNDVVG